LKPSTAAQSVDAKKEVVPDQKVPVEQPEPHIIDTASAKVVEDKKPEHNHHQCSWCKGTA